MCQSKAEGGQRCYGHARTRLTAAQAAYDASGSPDDLDYLIGVQAEFASTRQGELDIRDQISAAMAEGRPEQAALLGHVLGRGQMMAQVNQEVARLHRAKLAAAAAREQTHDACLIGRELHAALATQNDVMDLTSLRQAGREAAAAHAAKVAAAQPAKTRRSLFRTRRSTTAPAA